MTRGTAFTRQAAEISSISTVRETRPKGTPISCGHNLDWKRHEILLSSQISRESGMVSNSKSENTRLSSMTIDRLTTCNRDSILADVKVKSRNSLVR
jgi:hypothetical protein